MVTNKNSNKTKINRTFAKAFSAQKTNFGLSQNIGVNEIKLCFKMSE